MATPHPPQSTSGPTLGSTPLLCLKIAVSCTTEEPVIKISFLNADMKGLAPRIKLRANIAEALACQILAGLPGVRKSDYNALFGTGQLALKAANNFNGKPP